MVRRRDASTLLALGAWVACAGCAETGHPGAAIPETFAITVAPLSLDGVTDVDYALTVRNADLETVWSRTLRSSRYGDGAGGLSWVGPCDAASNPNTVELAISALEVDGVALREGVDFSNPAPLEAPLSQTVTCSDTADVAVTFDVTVARAARQGFFDVAVELDDVYCSAKLDCVDDDGEPLVLLHRPNGGGRGPTAVLAFSCTGGAQSQTHLYLSDLVISCPDGQTVVAPSLDRGLLSTAEGSGLPTAALYDALVTWGAEDLGGWSKLYWTVALGLDEVAGCTVDASATAADGALEGGETPAGATWPYLVWSAPLTQCGAHALDSGDGVVTTRYTSGMTFAHELDAAGARPTARRAAGQGTLADPYRWTDGTSAITCEAYRTPTAPYLYGGEGDGYYLLDPDGAGAGEAPFVTWCDMTWRPGEGWTLVRSSLATDPPGAVGTPGPATSAWLTTPQAMALAEESSQVHIRTTGSPDISATSVPETLPIRNLRAGRLLNKGTPSGSQAALWTGAMLARLTFSCSVAAGADWPAVYWACGNTSGLHWLGTHSAWQYLGTQASLELYVR